MNETCTFTLPYTPPYQWERMLDFLTLRAIPGVEAVRDGAYWRTVRALTPDGQQLSGWVCVKNCPEKSQIEVEYCAELAPAQEHLRTRLARLFDASRDPAAVGTALESMNQLHPGSFVAGTRIPGCYDGFEMVCRAVLGQQVSVKSASTLAGRMAATFGTPLATGIQGLTCLFPTPADIRALAVDAPIENALGPLGIIRTRSRTMLALAQLLEERPDAIEPCVEGSATPEEKIAALVALPGIGDWTGHYIAMRAMGWSDAFPATDLGVIKFLGTKKPKELIAAAETWRPWRSYAVLNMWCFEQAQAEKEAAAKAAAPKKRGKKNPT